MYILDLDLIILKYILVFNYFTQNNYATKF